MNHYTCSTISFFRNSTFVCPDRLEWKALCSTILTNGVGPSPTNMAADKMLPRKRTLVSHSKTRQSWWTVRPPHSSMNGRHSERPPQHDAINITGGLGGMVLWRRCGCGRRRSWVEAALRQPPLQFTVYLGRIWKYPINQREECSRGSVVPYLHRISLGIVGFERKGGEAVKLSNW